MNRRSSVCRPTDLLRQVRSNGSLHWEKSRPINKYGQAAAVRKLDRDVQEERSNVNKAVPQLSN
jgi:hypothetical protein